jgi:putative SOS response-associated peptidase YedK
VTKGRPAIIALVDAMRDLTGNMPSLPGVFPDFPAPIVRTAEDGVRELALVRWGMPSSRKALFEAATKRASKLRDTGKPIDFARLLRMEPDKGTTNIRNPSSAHWKLYLGSCNRCLKPFTSFSEPDQVGGTLRPI